MPVKSFKELEQFDNESGDYDCLDDIPTKYVKAIGEFLIVFSSVENIINLVISDMISDRAHDTGYRMIASLRMIDKIDFLYGILLNFISVTGQEKKKELVAIRDRLKIINTFRNNIVHANWQTLKNDGTVRTKIIIDNEDGGIKFENVIINIDALKNNISEAYSLIKEIDKFFMDAQNSAL